MREYAKKPENQYHTLDSNPQASKQAPISKILQAYRDKTFEKSMQKQRVDEEELLQGKFESTSVIVQTPVQREEMEKPNNTGLPDDLKSGIENLSGYSMDDVKVHYNSDKPAQLNALVYAQGTNIHIAPRQEKHFPREAWHVVQQMKGRVQSTTQIQGMNINDNSGLEKEADEKSSILLMSKFSNSFEKKRNFSKTNKTTQLMGLTTLGRIVTYFPVIRGIIGNRLMANSSINSFMNFGVCHDAVAYARYLLGAAITRNQILTLNGPEWLPLFDFPGGIRWNGDPIEVGRAVGFQYVHNNNIFHGTLSIEGTRVRGINGNLLGTGWQAVGDCDLARLIPVPGAEEGVYEYPDVPDIHIRIWISNL